MREVKRWWMACWLSTPLRAPRGEFTNRFSTVSSTPPKPLARP